MVKVKPLLIRTHLFSDDLEYVDFPNFPETWIGKWVKESIRCPTGMVKDITKCNFCSSTDFSSSRRGVLRSYRVRGMTKPGQFWEWPKGMCSNTMGRCWGEKERTWTVLKNTPENWIFRTNVSDYPGHSTLTDEMKVKLGQGNGENRLLYSGVTSGDRCRCFWPMLEEPQSFWPTTSNPYRKIVMTMQSGEPLPPDANINMGRFQYSDVYLGLPKIN